MESPGSPSSPGALHYLYVIWRSVLGIWVTHLQRAAGRRQPKISLVAGLSVNFEAGCPRPCNQAKFPDCCTRLQCTTPAGCRLLVVSCFVGRLSLSAVAGCWRLLADWRDGGMAGLGRLLDKPAAAKPQNVLQKKFIPQSGTRPTRNGRNSCGRLIFNALGRWRAQKSRCQVGKFID